jgi:hypothetical protein
MTAKVTIISVKTLSLPSVLTKVESHPDLNISKVQLLDAILHELSSNGSSDSDESDF